MKKIIAILFLANSFLNGTEKQDISSIYRYYWLYPNGQVARGTLRNPSIIGDVIYKADEISFYPNGQVRSGRLYSNQTIDMVQYSATNRWGDRVNIYFYPDGQVKQGRLNGTHIIDGIFHLDMHCIRFYADGTVHSSSPYWSWF